MSQLDRAAPTRTYLGGRPSLSRRRAAPARAARRIRRAPRRAARRRQRRALSRPGAAPLAGRPHLHPREMHDRARPASGSRSQCRAASEERPRRWRGCSRTIPRRSPARSRSRKRCSFSLDELNYEYPDEPVPPGKTAAAASRGADLAPRAAGAIASGDSRRRSRALLRDELALIARLDYARYFLTVHDIVALRASSKGILCQGRGSAANCAVCYCLGITAVDPGRRSTCCSSASSRPSATSRPTSTSTSSTSGARR